LRRDQRRNDEPSCDADRNPFGKRGLLLVEVSQIGRLTAELGDMPEVTGRPGTAADGGGQVFVLLGQGQFDTGQVFAVLLESHGVFSFNFVIESLSYYNGPKLAITVGSRWNRVFGRFFGQYAA
jgi:hypothetical protein